MVALPLFWSIRKCERVRLESRLLRYWKRPALVERRGLCADKIRKYPGDRNTDDAPLRKFVARHQATQRL
jgi:hypothetical protein